MSIEAQCCLRRSVFGDLWIGDTCVCQVPAVESVSGTGRICPGALIGRVVLIVCGECARAGCMPSGLFKPQITGLM